MTPLHLRRRVRQALWRRGHFLFIHDDHSFLEACEMAHIPGKMVGRFLVLSPDTTRVSAQEISNQTSVPVGIVRLIIRIQETPPDQRDKRSDEDD